MGTMALRPFYIGQNIGLFKFIDSPGYGIKSMTVGRAGVVVGECDNKFNLVFITDIDKQEIILSVLGKLRMESYKANIEKFNPRMLTKHYKITKRLDMIDWFVRWLSFLCLSLWLWKKKKSYLFG